MSKAEYAKLRDENRPYPRQPGGLLFEVPYSAVLRSESKVFLPRARRFRAHVNSHFFDFVVAKPIANALVKTAEYYRSLGS